MKMFKKIYNILTMIALIIIGVSLTGCNADDNNLSSEDLHTFIIGKWQSSYLLTTTSGEKEPVTKDNAHAENYKEFTFFENKSVIEESYQGDNLVKETLLYTIDGDKVLIKEKSSGWKDGISIDTNFDDPATRTESKEKTLFFNRKNNMLSLKNLYFKKQ